MCSSVFGKSNKPFADDFPDNSKPACPFSKGLGNQNGSF
jgi:hypothetical protein